MKRQVEEQRLREEVRRAGAAFAKTGTHFTDPDMPIEGGFGESWQPFQMGQVMGVSKQVHPSSSSTALLIRITRGGNMGEHYHEKCKWESVMWLSGKGTLSYRPQTLIPVMRTIELCPGLSKSHRADVPHNFTCETGSLFILAYTPRLPGDHLAERNEL